MPNQQSNPSNKNEDHQFVQTRRRKKVTIQRKLYRVSLLGKEKESINIIQAISYFNTAPVVKFCYHTVSFHSIPVDLLSFDANWDTKFCVLE